MGGLSTALSVVQLGQSLIQARKQAKAQNAAAEAQAQSQIQQIQRAQEIQARQRRERLRRALAAQRATFGSRGIGTGGSAAAVLKGLTNETERAIQDRRSLDSFRIGNINNVLGNTRRRNLLEASSAQRRSAFGLFQQGIGGFSLLEP